jgi:3-hydroxypropanoate dehydrogenase
MGRPLDDAGLDTIFRTARTYNGYDDTPVTEADIRRIYDLVKMGADLGQPAGGALRLADQPGSQGQARRSAERHQWREDPQGARHRDHRMDLAFNEQLPWLFPHAPTAKDWFPPTISATPTPSATPRSKAPIS